MEDSNFAEQYARAREASGQLVGEEVEEIARQTLLGKYDPNAARVAIDALKWSAGQKASKSWGRAESGAAPAVQLNAVVYLDRALPGDGVPKRLEATPEQAAEAARKALGPGTVTP